ncbi:thioesterase family protein [Mycobacterium sp. ITM-2016-00316]|uniref:acyl-CoA thioesterase n=1 Tax=Mycobacterium sp. ITM-2016-00316 TaxID=2099695 RepID=UPI000CF914D0|nr:acyl-CoA thioesterase domain-containing protein [Mycobacterium sp. ITM-2016-00316]WNG83444.1 thioesterase family protein [Mycobacterium sp. ITM-2016-00316]
MTHTPPEHTLEKVLDLLDVTPGAGDTFICATGWPSAGARQVVEGTPLLGQALVAAAKRFPNMSVRSAHAVFSRIVNTGRPVEFRVHATHEGRSTAAAVVAIWQDERQCATVTVLVDTPTIDVVRHQLPRAEVGHPDDAHPSPEALRGMRSHVVEMSDVNSAEQVGPPVLHAWLHYDQIPMRADLVKALLAYPAGHLAIAVALRPHPGFGTSQSHHSLSTGVLSASISFHEPVTFEDWLLYSWESTHAGAGMAYVRGTVHTADGELLASFTIEGMIRPLGHTAQPIGVDQRL